ncbi:trypsin protease precursor [Vibrio sp. MACH09]|uniref:trypsin-like serine protease n=1 Tax=Vibrio sp. MACH09 TaxID=3025122 RepID=UPI002793605E|nr:trypsin-like serine protease [Vibrio sp. MACH09]GLO64033.1 trypsin protease precursor [Vibrio sp. MACH09]
MKNIRILLLLVMLSCSYSVVATQQGTAVDWRNDYSNMVKPLNCSGTIIAGKFVLSAAHCIPVNANQHYILFSNLERTSFVNQFVHPLWSGGPTKNDVVIWELGNVPPTDDITFFANLNVETVSDDDLIGLYGFGYHASNASDLNMARIRTVNYDAIDVDNQFVKAVDIGQGQMVSGDSGGPWLNTSGEIVSISSATQPSSGGGSDSMIGINLTKSRDFILDTVDGWHYPTLANGNNLTITVQSLHQNVVSDVAYTDGNVVITGGSCVGKAVITAYEKCTYEVQATGEGKLYLTADEVISINKPAPTPSSDSGGGSGGGSIGWLALVMLLGVKFQRELGATRHA